MRLPGQKGNQIELFLLVRLQQTRSSLDNFKNSNKRQKNCIRIGDTGENRISKTVYQEITLTM